MRSELTEFSASYGVLRPGETVLCAVSGGADSVCLLHALLHAELGVRVLCAHFNHRLRGGESDRDERFVRELCEKWAVPFVRGEGDVLSRARAQGRGVEETARDMRYAFLERAAAERGAQWIAVAHTANDNAETVLLNLTRGTGPRGLCGIPPVRGRIVRPLLAVSRERVEQYLEEHALPHVEDSTNRDEYYARNRLRQRVMPVLQELNPGFLRAASRTAALLREDEAYLEGLAADFFAQRAVTDAKGALRLPTEALLALPGPVASRVLRRAAGGALSYRHTEALYALCRSADPSAELDLPGLRLRREYGWVVFHASGPELLPGRRVLPGQSLLLPEAGLLLRSGLEENCREIHRSFNTFYFSYEKICGTLVVKSRGEGDRIRLLGRAGTRSLKKMMIDAGIPRARRGTVPVLADDAGPLAVYGFGQAERCAAVPGEYVLKVEILPADERME